MGMQLSGSLQLTGSLNVSGSTVQIGNNTLTGNTVLSGSIDMSGSMNVYGATNFRNHSTTITGSLLVSGSTTQTGTNTLIGNTILSGSIIISGSDNVTTPTIRIYGDLQTDGVIKFDPVNKTIDNSISASYIFVSGSTDDLYFSQNGNGFSNITRLKWLESNLYTGVLSGGVVSQIDSTNYKISKGSGIIVNLNATTSSQEPYPTIKYIHWNDLSSSINALSASYDQTFVGIDSDGNITKQGTPYVDGQFNTLISVGLVLHQNHSTIGNVKTQPSLSYGLAQRVGVFTRAFGPLKIDGFILSGSGTQGIQVSAGTGYLEGAAYVYDANNPNYVIDGGTTTSKIWRYYNTSSYTDNVYDTNGGAGYSVLDPTKYSNNGTLTTVTGTSPANSEWTIQRVFWFPNSVAKAFVVYYGNAQYTSQALALTGLQEEEFAEAPNTAANGIYLGSLLLRKDFVWTDSTSYKIVPAGLFRSVSSGGGSTALAGANGTSGTSGVSGTSGLNGTFFGSSGTSGTNGTSGAGVANYYGNFFSTGSQNVAGANIATTASLESTGDANGISVQNTNGHNRITFANSGVYEITFSAMVQKTQGNAANLSIWFQKNGTKIDNSASYTALVSNSVYQIVTVPFIISLNAGDYLEVVFASDSQYVQIVDIAANAIDSSPQAPSWIVTAKQVGVAVGSTSGTSGTSGTSVDITLLNQFSGSVNSYTSSNDAIRNQILQTTASLNTYTSSNDSVRNRILQTTASLNTYTGSNDSIVQRLMQTTASLNTLTGSVSGIVNGLMGYTASLKGAAIVSSSTQIQNYNLFAQTSSANTFYGNQTISGSLFVSTTGISNATLLASSSNLVLGSGSNLYIYNDGLVSISGSLQVTGSIISTLGITGPINATNGVISSSAQLTTLNTYTSSNDSIISRILQTTASINTTTGSFSAIVNQILQTTASLNAYTASESSVVNRVLQTTASLNTYTSSNDNVVQRLMQATASINITTGSLLRIYQTTASLNTYTSSNDSVINRILQTTASLNSNTGSYITTGSAGLTQSITGSLAITGSMTISSGSITMPNRPGVRVTGAGGAKVAVTALSGSYTVVDWQQSNAWDNSTGLFTAPIAGLYQVNVIVRTNSNSLGTISQLIVYKNNTTGTTGTPQIMIEFGSNTTMNHTGGSTICKLAAGDTLRMVVAVGEISFDSNDNFSVAYIG